MDIYWNIEAIKVFAGYVFLMFIWPSVVFFDYLKKKSKIFWFSFCVTVQIVIVNTFILFMGLLHILNEQIVRYLFFGAFLFSVCRILINLKSSIWKKTKEIIANNSSSIVEYVLLLSVILFGMIYFSYGSFQIHTYGQYDTFLHHGWINKMAKGQIYPEGIYPVSMHCFIYCLYAMFRIRIYSIMLFFQCIHVTVFLLSAYCLMREIFKWRYSAVLVLTLYLTMDFTVSSMARLQTTLPMEFGLHTQFLCTLYLVRYLKYAERNTKTNRFLNGELNENLLLFTMSLTASIVSHYYVTIMAFVFCLSFAVFDLKKILRHMIPLVVSVLCGCFIAAAPMIGALASEIPFEASINWGLSVLYGNNEDSKGNDVNNLENGKTPLGLTDSDIEVIDKLPESGQKLTKGIIRIEYLIKRVYKSGYRFIYGNSRTRYILGAMLLVLCSCIINKRWHGEDREKMSNRYIPLILVSLLSVLIFIAYNSPDLGLLVLIPNHRFFPSGHMATLAVLMMPADILFSFCTQVLSDKILQRVSIVLTGGIYMLMKMRGSFHGYLDFSLTRYESAAFVTESIINEFQEKNFTVVSPMDDAYQVELYGKHQEISDFLTKCEKGNWYIPTEYVFIYVEKKPIEYYQNFYFSGPACLAVSGNSEIKYTEISKSAAREDLSQYINARWFLYKYGRTILESKAYEWCQSFAEKNPLTLKTYYEDEQFVCYYFIQDIEKPYDLAL